VADHGAVKFHGISLMVHLVEQVLLTFALMMVIIHLMAMTPMVMAGMEIQLLLVMLMAT
jgi:hypothetical protein